MLVVTSANLPPEIALVNSLKQHMGSVWVQHAMADACLFHATLFSASASIDILMGRQNNTVTLYHQTSTIRMLSERLNQETPLLNYGTLGSVLPLVFYNVSTQDFYLLTSIMYLDINDTSDGGFGPRIGSSTSKGACKNAPINTKNFNGRTGAANSSD